METDLLGAPYERHTIDLGEDDEGPVVATLIRRRAATPTRRAVLYLHGWADYFFQTHLADYHVERCWDFYALDLRKYGRSLLEHQTPNFCRSVSEYFPELDESIRIVRDQDDHDTVLLSAHSTGGLIGPLWAHARPDAKLIDGIFLNSPFFDFNAAWVVRRPVAAAVTRVARRWPYRVLPITLSQVYGQSLHAEHRGEWAYDVTWKPMGGFPVTAGWLSAIREAHLQLRKGLDIRVPILLACSTTSARINRWDDAAHRADLVLDVEHIVRWAPRLGRHVTLARIEGGKHDLVLSEPPARERVFSELGRWLSAYLPDPGQPPAGPSTPGPAVPADHD